MDQTGQTIRAKSIAALLKAIADYRSNNALPAGNPVVEVERFYRSKFPWLVADYRDGETVKPTDPLPDEDFRRPWINQLWRDPPKKWQETEKARARIEICNQCRFKLNASNLPLSYSRRLLILGAGRISEVGIACSVNAWDCGLAAWMESPVPRKEVVGCWATGKP